MWSISGLSNILVFGLLTITAVAQDLHRAGAAGESLFALAPAYVERDGERAWAGGSTYKACFEHGVRFYPHMGADREAMPLRWRTVSVRVGADELFDLSTGPRRIMTDRRIELRYADGALVEAYDVLERGLEQTFVLRDRPAVWGDLVITGSIDTSLRAEAVSARHGAVRFRDASGVALVDYGAALALDREGRELPLDTSFDGERIRLHVPAEFLASAAYPVVVDPLIVATAQTLLSSVNEVVATAWDPLNGLAGDHYVVLEATASRGDRDILVVSATANWTGLGGVFFEGSTDDTHSPTAAGNYFAFVRNGVQLEMYDATNPAPAPNPVFFQTNNPRNPQLSYRVPNSPFGIGGFLIAWEESNKVRFRPEGSIVVTDWLDSGLVPGTLALPQLINTWQTPEWRFCYANSTHIVSGAVVEAVAQPFQLRVTEIDRYPETGVNQTFIAGGARAVNFQGRGGNYDEWLIAYRKRGGFAPDEIRAYRQTGVLVNVASRPWKRIASGQGVTIDDLEFYQVLDSSVLRSHWALVHHGDTLFGASSRISWIGDAGELIETLPLSGVTGAGSSGLVGAVTFNHDVGPLMGGVQPPMSVVYTRPDVSLLQFAYLDQDQTASWQIYGTGCGPGTIGFEGMPYAGSRRNVVGPMVPFSLSVALLVGRRSAGIPLDAIGMPSCFLNVDSIDLAINPGGPPWTFQPRITLPGGIHDADLYFQWIYLWPGTPLGVGASPGLHLRSR